MYKIGVVGAGVMGSSIAQCFAQYGYSVLLMDSSQSVLHNAEKAIFRSLSFQKFSAQNDNPKQILARITIIQELSMMHDCDIVIESITESWKDKESLYRELDAICKKHCIFASNTSCISITQIASVTNRPLNIIGIHFMNPIPSISTVEVIRGYHTSEETVQATIKVLQSIEKKAIIVNDLPGFVTNRISHVFMNEAAFVVQDGIASAEDVDAIFKECYGHKMGPLETADLIGLDTIVNSLDVLYESYHDTKYRCCPFLRKLVYAGHLGRKTGKGFHEYF